MSRHLKKMLFDSLCVLPEEPPTLQPFFLLARSPLGPLLALQSFQDALRRVGPLNIFAFRGCVRLTSQTQNLIFEGLVLSFDYLVLEGFVP